MAFLTCTHSRVQTKTDTHRNRKANMKLIRESNSAVCFLISLEHGVFLSPIDVWLLTRRAPRATSRPYEEGCSASVRTAKTLQTNRSP